ncbi:hypothetical protein SDC9_147802 [bioreactor metagenome]|uniref:Uncharacterized protein n=1 Tax=bioreactor metagenome TaxID=1076179 RepID=A0A645EGN5_9ZZZZ
MGTAVFTACFGGRCKCHHPLWAGQKLRQSGGVYRRSADRAGGRGRVFCVLAAGGEDPRHDRLHDAAVCVCGDERFAQFVQPVCARKTIYPAVCDRWGFKYSIVPVFYRAVYRGLSLGHCRVCAGHLCGGFLLGAVFVFDGPAAPLSAAVAF